MHQHSLFALTGTAVDTLASINDRESSPHPPALDARLDEIGRKLRAIQVDLAPLDTPPASGDAPAASELTISAGPFGSLEALRAFAHELARLPGVRGVQVRGYEGRDRALIEVRLDSPTT